MASCSRATALRRAGRAQAGSPGGAPRTGLPPRGWPRGRAGGGVAAGGEGPGGKLGRIPAEGLAVAGLAAVAAVLVHHGEALVQGVQVAPAPHCTAARLLAG